VEYGQGEGHLFPSQKAEEPRSVVAQLDGGPRNLEFVSNLLTQYAIGSHSDNPSTLDKPVRETSSCGPSAQRGSFVGRQSYDFGNSHADST
jgi:hypothetical protein